MAFITWHSIRASQWRQHQASQGYMQRHSRQSVAWALDEQSSKRLQERKDWKADDKFLNDELDKDSYNRIVLKTKERQKELEERISMLQIENRKAMEPKLKYSIDLISNLGDFIENAPLEVKIKLLGSMFPQKIEYDGKKYRTTEYNQVLDLIYHETNKLRGGDNEKTEEDCSSSASVP